VKFNSRAERIEHFPGCAPQSHSLISYLLLTQSRSLRSVLSFRQMGRLQPSMTSVVSTTSVTSLPKKPIVQSLQHLVGNQRFSLPSPGALAGVQYLGLDRHQTRKASTCNTLHLGSLLVSHSRMFIGALFLHRNRQQHCVIRRLFDIPFPSYYKTRE
jgi:hypothetical protein